MVYVTQDMDPNQVIRFIRCFDAQVGTEREITNTGNATHTIMCFDLEPCEIDICKEIETNTIGE